MILLPKYKELIVPELTHSMGIKGEYRCVKYNEMGQVNLDTGWKQNLITDIGLTLKITTSVNRFYIGSSATAPDVSNVAMGSLLASSGVAQGATIHNTPTAPDYEKYSQRAMRFGAGVGTGTINEVGFGTEAGSNYLMARQIVSPAITKASNETLDVYWRIYFYPDLSDTAGTVVIAGITYDYVLRLVNVDAGAGNPFNTFTNFANESGTWVYDGPLGALTANTATGAFAFGSGLGSFVTGTAYRQFTQVMELNSNNLANGIRTVQHDLQNNNFMTLQMEFTAQTPSGAVNPLCIPKDATKQLTIVHRRTISRH